MNCGLCKNGTTENGNVNVTLMRKETVIIIKGVPAEICQNCGEYYLSSEITRSIYKIADNSLKKGVEVEIIKYVA